MATVVHGKPVRLGADRRWVARATYLDTRTGLVPIGVEVRPVLPGENDERPSGQDRDWPRLPSELDPAVVPAGGLPLAALRGIDWREQWVRAEKVVTRSLAELNLFDRSGERLREFLTAVTAAAVRRGMLRPGRRDLTRSFLALIEASGEADTGGSPPTRRQVLHRLQQAYPDFDETELRATLQWARTHRPPLFTSNGQRRAGGTLSEFAQRILVLAEPLDVLSPDERDEVLAQRAVDLPEFRQ